MDFHVLGAPLPEQVASFFQKHRTGLVTLVFTDLVDSTALLSQLGDQGAKRLHSEMGQRWVVGSNDPIGA